MHLARRLLPLLLLAPLTQGPPAAAQPWASESARLAGRAALEAVRRNQFLEADSLSLAADPVVRKLVVWNRVQNRQGGASAAEIVAWLDANPDWPFPLSVAMRAEEALVAEPDDALALRQFGRAPPRTLAGLDRYVAALLRAGRPAEAQAALARGWRDAAGDGFAEQGLLARHGGLLTVEDHWQRADRQFWDGQPGAAARMMPLLDATRRAIIEARLAAASSRAEPPSAIRDIGAALEVARQQRRADRDADAAATWIAAEPLQQGLSADAARAIWVERQVLSRKLLRLGDAATAYRIAAAHGQTEPGEPRGEGEFLAGFLALRKLGQPDRARQHFARVGQDSSSVITRARSAFWQGAALSAMGRTAEAQAQWREAAALPVAFYGQLASLSLGESPAQLAARIAAVPSAAPSQPVAAQFLGRDLVRAVIAMADLGQSDRARIFLLRLEELAAEPADRWLTARLGVAIGRPDHAVWIARRAGADGVMLLEDGWPTPYPTPADGAEPALVNAITRQESNFDLSAVSSANARGPMQLLPSTAAGVARRLGVPHSTAMLTADAAHNLRLGSAYINDMLGRFDGAMPLAAAGYNAGPGRVVQWLGTYGDPRQPDGPHILDWMEQIPFGETRNYVQRVIENVVIYRARNAATAGLPHPLAALMAGRP
ncbi:lytic transglycosylase domain-containing protein [Falsiroseomonas selenitidurans]|uniref:Lytic transglycosylase domain-containing protein n=1 Tax=Falsiroseomonas selenitidurans TaxID=2716335 RepID=A0ABX1E0S4_9PROT|nr:lytic transglycosylase domain-containing protein [Falsiroseomonas selenitidurans]NKC30373.1 lytic transglycosylase domain-containing protein [Falsiroseomonas selenitidurans]